LVELGLDAPDVASAVATYRSTIQKMERNLSDRLWLLGERFTLADACLAPYFQTLYQFAWTDLFADSPAVEKWYERCRSRDSYQQAVSNDFAPDVLAKLQSDGKAAWPKLSQHLTVEI
jgi:glutathione S-transferase